MNDPSGFEDAAEAAPMETPEDSGSETQNEEANGQTSILPKDFFGPDAKVGDTHQVKVVSIHDDALEVQPISDSAEESSEDQGQESAAPPDAEMSSMLGD